MNLIQSIQSGFKKSFDFQSRASRSEFNYWILFSCLTLIILTIIDETLVGLNIIIYVPSISISVRRLHDIDRTGWWSLTSVLLPLVIVYVMVKKGTIGKNSYGEDPLKDKSPNDKPLIVDKESEKQQEKSEPLLTDESNKKTVEKVDPEKGESKSTLEPLSVLNPEATNQVANLYDKFPHLNEEPKEFNFGKIMGLPFITIMLAFDDDGDEQEKEVIGNIVKEVWGVPILTSPEKADEMFNELATWYNALNKLPEYGMKEKYAIIEWVIESLKYPSGLVEETMRDLMVQKGVITEAGSTWGPKYFMESLIKIANANNKVTDDERSFLIWCAKHLGYDIDFNTLTFTVSKSSEPLIVDKESEKEETPVSNFSEETITQPVEPSGDPVEDFRSFLASKYPTLKLPEGEKYVEFLIGKGMFVCCMVKTNGVNVYLYSEGKVPAREVFHKINSQGISGKVLNDKYTITPMPGSSNPNVVRIDLLIPYDGRDLNSNELRNEVNDVYSQLLKLCKGLI